MPACHTHIYIYIYILYIIYVHVHVDKMDDNRTHLYMPGYNACCKLFWGIGNPRLMGEDSEVQRNTCKCGTLLTLGAQLLNRVFETYVSNRVFDACFSKRVLKASVVLVPATCTCCIALVVHKSQCKTCFFIRAICEIKRFQVSPLRSSL